MHKVHSCVVCEIQWLRDVHGMCAISQSLENACVMYKKIGPADGHNSVFVAGRAQTPELRCVREPGVTLPSLSRRLGFLHSV